jgi:uncharacterized membrane protein
MGFFEIVLVGWFFFIFTSYTLLVLYQHWHFYTGIDLGVFSQAVFHYSRFEAPSSSIIQCGNLLGDHFHPILIVLAPFYWLFPTAEVLCWSPKPF